MRRQRPGVKDGEQQRRRAKRRGAARRCISALDYRSSTVHWRAPATGERLAPDLRTGIGGLTDMLNTFAAACLAAVVSRAASAAAVEHGHPEKFTAFAVNTSNMTARRRRTPVDITINRWSTDADRDRLLHDLSRERGRTRCSTRCRRCRSSATSTRRARCATTCTSRGSSPQPEGGRRIVLEDRSLHRLVGSGEPSAHDRLSVHPDRAAARQERARRRQGVDLHQDDGDEDGHDRARELRQPAGDAQRASSAEEVSSVEAGLE